MSPFAAEHRAVADAFAAFTGANALRAGVPASHARVGFVVADGAAAVDVLTAVANQLRAKASAAKWTLPKQGAHFRASAIETRGKAAGRLLGQGSQYANMFDDAAMNWPPMRAAVSAMDAQSAAARPKGTPLVSEVLYPRAAYESEAKPDHDRVLSDTLHSQPATVAVAVGAYDVFKNAGLKADYTAGHSLGEIAALHAAGALDRDTAFNLVCHRATAMAEAAKMAKGQAMAAVIGPGASELSVAGGDVWLANLNEPGQRRHRHRRRRRRRVGEAAGQGLPRRPAQGLGRLPHAAGRRRATRSAPRCRRPPRRSSRRRAPRCSRT